MSSFRRRGKGHRFDNARVESLQVRDSIGARSIRIDAIQCLIGTKKALAKRVIHFR